MVKIKLWVDDVRQPPDSSWTVARSVTQAICMIAKFDPEVISIDHDIGHEAWIDDVYKSYPCHETFEAVAWFIAEKYYVLKDIEADKISARPLLLPPKIIIHSGNPVGAESIKEILARSGIKSLIQPV